MRKAQADRRHGTFGHKRLGLAGDAVKLFKQLIFSDIPGGVKFAWQIAGFWDANLRSFGGE